MEGAAKPGGLAPAAWQADGAAADSFGSPDLTGKSDRCPSSTGGIAVDRRAHHCSTAQSSTSRLLKPPAGAANFAKWRSSGAALTLQPRLCAPRWSLERR